MDGFHHLCITDTAILAYHKTDEDSTLYVFLFRIADIMRKVLHQGVHSAIELGHVLNHIKHLIIGCVLLFFNHIHGNRSGLIILWGFSHLDFLSTHLDGGVLLTFLHGVLLLRTVIDVIVNGVCIER